MVCAYKYKLQKFQHTAARRRLGASKGSGIPSNFCFNTQPPEGGWLIWDIE